MGHVIPLMPTKHFRFITTVVTILKIGPSLALIVGALLGGYVILADATGACVVIGADTMPIDGLSSMRAIDANTINANIIVPFHSTRR